MPHDWDCMPDLGIFWEIKMIALRNPWVVDTVSLPAATLPRVRKFIFSEALSELGMFKSVYVVTCLFLKCSLFNALKLNLNKTVMNLPYFITNVYPCYS